MKTTTTTSTDLLSRSESTDSAETPHHHDDDEEEEAGSLRSEEVVNKTFKTVDTTTHGTRRRRLVAAGIAVVAVIVTTVTVIVVFLRDENYKEQNNPNLKIQSWESAGVMKGTQDLLGQSVALSADGNVLVAGAPHASVSTRGQGRVQAWNSTEELWISTTLLQDESLFAGLGINDFFGNSVALSRDGSVMAVGAGHGGTAGYVKVLQWNGTQWETLGDTLYGVDGLEEGFGASVALDASGHVLAVGANKKDGGSVSIFQYNGKWTRRADVLRGTSPGDHFGTSVALSYDGKVLAVGATQEDYEEDEKNRRRGYVHVFADKDDRWTRRGAQLVGVNSRQWFGESIDLSADGTVIVVGARRGGEQHQGQARVFQWQDDVAQWKVIGNALAGKNQDDAFGVSVALSSDGETVVVGSKLYDSDAHVNTGRVRVYAWDRELLQWQAVGGDLLGQDAADNFGTSVAMSADGRIIAASSPSNDGWSGQIRVFKAFLEQ